LADADDSDAKLEAAERAPEPKEARTSAYRDDGPPRIRVRKPAPTLWQRATYRWTAITAVMATLLVVYTQHPYYLGNQFAPFRPFYTFGFIVWLALGLFYVRATLQKFTGTRYVVRDGGLHLLLLAKAFQQKKLWRTAKNPRVRTTLLGILVKAFYTPLMVGFFSGHANGIAEGWLRHKGLPGLRFVVPKGNALVQAQAWFHEMWLRVPDLAPSLHDFSGLLSPGTWTRGDVSWGLAIAYDIVFFIDCGWALMGYSLESRWLGNKTRSVEPTALGWAAALSCYPPFNNSLGTYLPLNDGKNWITDDSFAPWLKYIISGEEMALGLRGLTVLLFFVYAMATVAFGFKFSNLTNRGTVSRGPYRFVRHPAYLCKCLAWWLEHIPTITITKAFFLSLLCCVYALRAWTEERHLSRDPDYRAYKKKVPWIFIPGVY
jgi:protein-S-isoprenylcysteine O-methyltransferase Ste14